MASIVHFFANSGSSTLSVKLKLIAASLPSSLSLDKLGCCVQIPTTQVAELGVFLSLVHLQRCFVLS